MKKREINDNGYAAVVMLQPQKSFLWSPVAFFTHKYD